MEKPRRVSIWSTRGSVHRCGLRRSTAAPPPHHLYTSPLGEVLGRARACTAQHSGRGAYRKGSSEEAAQEELTRGWARHGRSSSMGGPACRGRKPEGPRPPVLTRLTRLTVLTVLTAHCRATHLSGLQQSLPCCPVPRCLVPAVRSPFAGLLIGPVRQRRPGRTRLPPRRPHPASLAGDSRRRRGPAFTEPMPRELRRHPFAPRHDEGPHRNRWGPSWTWTISRSRAVAAGFEPAVAINHTSFRVMHLRPLGHATAEQLSGLAAHGSNLRGADASQVTRRRAVAPPRCSPWRAEPWRARWIRTPLG